MRAVRSALKGVEERILRGHVEHCVAEAIRSSRRGQRDARIDELLHVLTRYGD